VKITVEIASALLEEARRLASREGTTVRALVEEGLRQIVGERKRAASFQLRRATFKGSGLQPHLAGALWEGIRDLAYKDRGA
jgi:CRISPR/Cas system-associated protein Csm6